MSLREVNYLKWLKDLHSRRILRPNLLDDSGLSQVHHCAYRGFLSCLKWLAKHGGSLLARLVQKNFNKRKSSSIIWYSVCISLLFERFKNRRKNWNISVNADLMIVYKIFCFFKFTCFEINIYIAKNIFLDF